jgi:hypothetical protein
MKKKVSEHNLLPFVVFFFSYLSNLEVCHLERKKRKEKKALSGIKYPTTGNKINSIQ